MRRTLSALIATGALLVAGCGSDDEADEDRATTTPAGGQVTATTEAPATTQTTPTTPTTTATTADSDELSAEGRAVLDATQDLADDVAETGEEFVRGRIEQDEAVARLDLARERANALRERAQQLPAPERERLASLNEEISRTATAISREVSTGRDAARDDIDRRIADLREEARSTFDAVTRQLDRQTRERLREALDRIGVQP